MGGMLWRLGDVLRRRGALVYTVGVWTVVGSVIYYTTGHLKREAPPEMPEGEEMKKVVSEDGLRETTIYRKPGSSFYTVTTTEYEPDFVPYNVRLHNFIQSFFGDSKGK